MNRWRMSIAFYDEMIEHLACQSIEKDAEIERLKGQVVALECNAIKHGWGELTAENQRLREALQSAAWRIYDWPFSWDGDCGITVVADDIEKALAATAQGGKETH